MQTIALPNFRLSFQHALIRVPRDGSDWDWMCEDWIDIPQDIQIVQGAGFATVFAKTGYGSELGEHLVSPVSPALISESSLIACLNAEAASRHTQKPRESAFLRCERLSWGLLVEADWSKLGYAPGGIEHYLLPDKGYAIRFGFLRLDWKKLVIDAVSQSPL